MEYINLGEPLFAFTRKEIPEIIIHACWAIKIQGRNVEGKFKDVYFATRSLLKPWQFLTATEFDSSEMWTMGISSHSGQDIHIEQLQRLLEFSNASENDLICPRAFPLDQSISARMRDTQQSARRLLHPCSGKHLGMIIACKQMGVETKTYWNTDHKLQQKIYSYIGREAGEKLIWMTDSCGVPNAAMSVGTHLHMWEKLASANDVRSTTLKELWIKNYRLAGGIGRLDTDLMDAGRGRILAKEGADGLLIVQSLPESGNPCVGIFLKILSGYNSAFLALGLKAILESTENLPRCFDHVKQMLNTRFHDWVPQDQTYRSYV